MQHICAGIALLMATAVVYFTPVETVQAQAPKRAIDHIVSEQDGTKLKVTMYFTDARSVIIYVEGNIAQIASVASPNNKLAATADAITTLSLVSGPLPGASITQVPAPNVPAKPQVKNDPPPENVAEWKESTAGKVARNAVAAIMGQDGKAVGDAVLVATDRAVTMAAIVGDSKELRLRFGGEDDIPGKVIRTDPTTGLALVQLVSGKHAVIPLGKGTLNEKVFAISSPYGDGNTVRSGSLTTTNAVVKPANAAELTGLYGTDVKIDTTNRGGALVSAKGELLGITCSWPSIEGNFAMPASSVLTLLAKGGE